MAEPRDSERLFLVHQAAIHDVREMLTDLLKQQHDPNEVDSLGRTPLHDAAFQGHDECLRILIQYGGDPKHVAVDGMSVLHRAAWAGHLSCVQLLVEHGADPSDLGNVAVTPAKMALREEHYKVVQYLHEQAARFLEEKKCAEILGRVMTCFEEGDVQRVVDMVLESPTILDHPVGRASEGHSLITWLCQCCMSQKYRAITTHVIGHLLSVSATRLLSLPSLPSLQSPMHVVSRSQDAHCLRLLAVLLQHATKVCASYLADSVPEHGTSATPFMYTDAVGNTPLHAALINQHLDSVKLMLGHNHATEDAGPSGPCPWAALTHHWLHILNKQGKTAYHLACKVPDPQFLRCVLETCRVGECKEVRQPLEIVCCQGLSPLVEAISANLPGHAEMLLDHGARKDTRCELKTPLPPYLTSLLVHLPGLPLYPWLLAHFQRQTRLTRLLLADSVVLPYFAKHQPDPVLASALPILMAYYPNAVAVSEEASSDGHMTVKGTWRELCLQVFEGSWLQAILAEKALQSPEDRQLMLTQVDISSNALVALPREMLIWPHLKVVICAQNKLTCLPDDLAAEEEEASCLEQLNVSNNRISALPSCLFRLPSLTRLVASGNDVESVPAGVWTSPKLSTLNLKDNKLKSFPAPPPRPVSALNSLPGLAEMPGGASLTSLDPCPATQPRADVSASLCLGVNVGNSEHFGSHAIRTSSSSGVSLSSEPGAGRSLTGSLCGSGSKSSWRHSCQLAKSRHPGYGVRCVPVLEDQLLDMDQLHQLHQPRAVGSARSMSFSSLAFLDLSHNKLAKIPEGLSCFAPHLRRLNLSHNRLDSLGYVQDYPSSLEDLNLSASCSGAAVCSLQPSPTASLAAVHCPCQPAAGSGSVPAGRCKNASHRQLSLLAMLDLSGNALSRVDLLGTPDVDSQSSVSASRPQQGLLLYPQLAALDLSNNDLPALPDGVGRLRELRSLRLGRNRRIQQLPDELGALPTHNLCELSFDGLDLLDPPVTIVKQGIPATLAFLKGRLKKSVPFRHMKLMLVGLDGQGKTTLLRLLRREAPAVGQLLSTVGIELGEWKCQPPHKFFGGPVPPPVIFSTWDFAGQRDYYATHQCFLSTRSLFLAVWRVPTGEAGLQDIDDWLRNIQARVSGATVIVVGTHIDLVSGGLAHCQTTWAPIVRARYHINPSTSVEQEEHGFPRVVDVKFVCGAGNGQHIDDLCSCIYDTACNIPAHRATRIGGKLVEQEIPASYIVLQERVAEFRQRLPSGTPPVMSSQEFRETFSGVLGDADELEVAAQFLHDNGFLLHFKDSKLQNVYFLDPQWLCRILSRVITVRAILPFVTEGLLQVDCLHQVFNNERYPPELIQPCIQLLEKFEVALPVDADTILIPSKLPMLPPALAKQCETSKWVVSGVKYQRLYIMVYVPNGFWPLLITRLLCSELKASLLAYAARSDASLSADTTTVRWRLWRSGMQLLLQDIPVLTVEEVAACDMLRHADTTPANASLIDGRSWQPLILLGPAKCLHLTLLDFKERSTSSSADTAGLQEPTVEESAADESPSGPEPVDTHAAARLALLANVLAECTDAVDTLLNDWYPGVGGRESRMSNGTPYVTRCHVCPQCAASLAAPGILWENLSLSALAGEVTMPPGNVRCIPAPSQPPADDVDSVFLLDQLIGVSCSGMNAIHCHRHGPVSIASMAPDVLFKDLSEEALVEAESVEWGALAGAGSFGDVYRGVLRLTEDKNVAIKLFQRSYVPGHARQEQMDHATHRLLQQQQTEAALSLAGVSLVAQSFALLRQETGVLWRFQHDNIVGLCGVMLNPPSLLLEWAPGGALDSCLTAYASSLGRLHQSSSALYGLPISTLLAILRQVADGLSYLHEMSIIYRDLKADNILVWAMPSADDLASSLLPSSVGTAASPPGLVHIKLSDYGISRVSGIGGVCGLAGTPGYMAPEIVKYAGQEAYSKLVDIYSFGMLIYELMTLARPYFGVSPNHVEALVRRGVLPYPTTRVLNYPVQLQLLMQHCSALEPAGRPANAQLLRQLCADSLVCMVDKVTLPDVHGSVTSITMASSQDGLRGDVLWLSSVGGDDEGGDRHSVHCIRYGGDKHVTAIRELAVDVKLRFLCFDGKRVWACSSLGDMLVLDAGSGALIYQWYIAGSARDSPAGGRCGFLPGAQVLCLHYVAALSEVLVALSSGVLLAYPSDEHGLLECLSHNATAGLGPRATAIKTTFLLHAVVVGDADGQGSVQLWCGHAGGHITVLAGHDFSELARLRHPESHGLLWPKHTVLFAAASSAVGNAGDIGDDGSGGGDDGDGSVSSYMWTAAHPSQTLHCWRVPSRGSPDLVDDIDCGAAVPDESFSITSLSCVGQQLAVSMSNGYVVVVDTAQRLAVRSLHLCEGPIQFGLILSFVSADSRAVSSSPSSWLVPDSHIASWLPLYIRNAYRRLDQPSPALLITCGSKPSVPAHCQPLSSLLDDQQSQASSPTTMCLWDGQYIFGPAQG